MVLQMQCYCGRIVTWSHSWKLLMITPVKGTQSVWERLPLFLFRISMTVSMFVCQSSWQEELQKGNEQQNYQTWAWKCGCWATGSTLNWDFVELPPKSAQIGWSSQEVEMGAKNCPSTSVKTGLHCETIDTKNIQAWWVVSSSHVFKLSWPIQSISIENWKKKYNKCLSLKKAPKWILSTWRYEVL